MSRTTCPLTIVILAPRSKSPVRAEKCQAVVYWDREGQYYYVRPQTQVKAYIRVRLTSDGRSFECKIDALNFLKAFNPQHEVNNSYV